MLRFVRCFYHRWFQHETTLRAAALTYYAVFSIFPMLLLITSGLGWFLRDPAYQKRAIDTFVGLAPQGSMVIVRLVQEIVLSHSVTNYVAALTLLWSASGFLRGLLAAITIIHDGELSRNGLLLRAWSVALLGLLMIVLLVMLAVLTLAARLIALLPIGKNSLLLHTSVHHLVLFGTASTAFYLLFRLVPKRKGKHWQTLLAAGLTAATWAAVNNGFAQYLAASLPRLNVIYGSIAAVVALMLYLYLVNLVILAGAQIHAVLRDLSTCSPPPLPLVETLARRFRR